MCSPKSTFAGDDLYFPSPKTVIGRCLGAFLRGEELTHKDAWIRFASSRLAHHVLALRQRGWPVEMVWEEVNTSDSGRVAQIGRYWLSHDVIVEAGERGQAYAAECLVIEMERKAK